MLADVEIYYNATMGLPSPEFLVKPVGYTFILKLLTVFYKDFFFWGIITNFVVSTFLLYLLYRMTNERIMWLLFFFPSFLYWMNYPIEMSIFVLLIMLAEYFYTEKEFFSNLIANISSLFRIEGVIFSFYFLIRRIRIRYILLFLTTVCLSLYLYAIPYLKYNYEHNPPPFALLRISIPFLVLLMIRFKKFFDEHFWFFLTFWIIMGLMMLTIKFFDEWNIIRIS